MSPQASLVALLAYRARMQALTSTSVLLMQTTAQTAQPSPEKQEAVSRGAFITMFVLLVIIAILMMYGIGRSIRRRREALQRASAKPTQVSRPDPWAESARRIATPEASDLEDTRVGASPPTDDLSESTATRTVANVTGDAPIVMITGAGKRIGRALALHFAQQGCDLILTYNQSRIEAESLSREVSALGRQATLYQLSLDDLHAVRAFSTSVASTLPRLDVLIHNASAYEPTPARSASSGSFETGQLESAERQMRVNALAPLILTLSLASSLEKSALPHGGCVIALGDIHAMGHPRKDHSAYAMSKAALHEMVRSLARDLAPQVRVNAIALGVALWPESGNEANLAEQAKYLRRVPLAREGTPEDVAHAAHWLAFGAAYITGQIIPVDGGRGLT
jgi:pteridine reductase